MIRVIVSLQDGLILKSIKCQTMPEARQLCRKLALDQAIRSGRYQVGRTWCIPEKPEYGDTIYAGVKPGHCGTEYRVGNYLFTVKQS